MWLIIAIAAGFASSLDRVITNVSLRDKEYSVLLYSFVYQTLITIFLLPYTFGSTFVFTPTNLVFVVIQVISWSFATILGFTATKTSDVSITSIISRSRMLWVLPLSFFFLDERLSHFSYLGIFLIFAGFFILFWKTGIHRLNGIQFTLIGSIFAAIGMFSNSYLIHLGVKAPTVSLFMVYGQAIAMLILWLVSVIKNGHKDVKIKVTANVVLTAFIESFAVLGLNFAYQLGPTSSVTAVYLAMAITSVWIGIVILKEKVNIQRVIASSLLVIIGTILLRV